MANFEILNFTHTWILSKYSKQLKTDGKSPEWNTLESTNFGTPITLSITPTNFLLIKHENDIHEFINLWSNRSGLKGIYKGNSLLIMFKTKDVLRKFRVQFLDSNMKKSEFNCMECIKELNKFIEIFEYGSEISFEAKYYSNQMPEKNITTDSSLDLNQIAKTLMTKNEHKLPLIYQQESENELLNGEEDKVLQEFIICCLLDPKFPNFVKKVDNLFNTVLKDEF
ncbi:unnamed protein product [Brachionus calyciflorus]|uniref:Meiotic recombination protein REC114 n=1 Tax=Brachionus calyciflorus TaxID=104777 RepID=A0A813VEP4_9BILA|nr:unnamed protein product [Brachionus calyciflorus]